MRSVQRSLWWRKGPVLRFVPMLIRLYIESLMAHPLIFFFVLMSWVTVSASYFYCIQTASPPTYSAAAAGALTFLFGESVQFSDFGPMGSGGVVLFSIVGLMHLGMFISHVYSLVAKR
jgi:hypothetical protein